MNTKAVMHNHSVEKDIPLVRVCDRCLVSISCHQNYAKFKVFKCTKIQDHSITFNGINSLGKLEYPQILLLMLQLTLLSVNL